VVDGGHVRLLLCYETDDDAFDCRQSFNIQLKDETSMPWLAAEL